MATEQAPEQAGGAAEYIGHHLNFATHQFGNFTVNVDTVIVSILLGFVGLGFIWWAARGATSGVPTKRQAFIEITFDFIDRQVQDIFHGDRHRFVAPLALTVFIWVILMNAMDFLPADIIGKIPEAAGVHHGFRMVPTADTNTTFALALTVWALMIGFAMKVKGVGGFFHELFTAPFGGNPLLWPVNFLFNLVEYVSKPLSHSLRLFGNMYAGEIIYLLLWLLAGAGIVAGVSAVALGVVWSIFHILIVALQAYIFMMLTVVYVQMAHEGH